MEFFSAIIIIGIVMLFLLIPLALIAGGLGLLAGAAKTIHDVMKGKKNG